MGAQLGRHAVLGTHFRFQLFQSNWNFLPRMKPQKPQPTHAWVLGIDASLTATAVFAAEVNIPAVRGGVPAEEWFVNYRTMQGATDSSDPIDLRLYQMHLDVYGFVKGLFGGSPETIGGAAVEGFSFGARFQRENMGMAVAAARLGYVHAFPRDARPPLIGTVSPAAAKKMACPTWAGFSKENWARAKRAGKFKRSMPDKDAVRSGFFARFKIGASVVSTEHLCDAACVAACVAESLYRRGPRRR